ncbi:MAG: hypothetical protein ISQ11_00145 [Planctomycetes bacterium]|nr:hypothetical protein [Planctomycetota bacterium]
MLRPVLIAAALAASLSGCRGTSVATQNLDAVLSSTDNFRYRGATTNQWKDLMDLGFNSLRSVVSAEEKARTEQNIPDPTEFAFENLVDLSASTQGPTLWRHNEQVRVLARFAVYAPSQLCRELAIRQLRVHAERLELDGTFSGLEQAASAAELIEAVDGLTDALRTASRRRLDDTARADFAAAITLVEELEVDVQGGARLLGALGPFLKGRLLPTDLRQRVAALSLEVQRRLVAEAYWRGVRDTSAFVRASALSISMALHGDPYRIEALLTVIPTEAVEPWITERYRTFDLPAQPLEDAGVLIAVAQAFEAEGLPLAARRDTVEGLQLRAAIVVGFLQVAATDLLYPRRARHAAMDTLGALTSGEVVSLRPEVWERWWLGVRPELEDQIRAATDG